MWHIAKRELYDNLNSLRFALTTVLLLGLMLTNALMHLQEHPAKIKKYRSSVTDALNALRSRTDLYDIAQRGPGLLYKKPSALGFCAEGGDTLLPDAVGRNDTVWEDGALKSFWTMKYPSTTPDLKDIRSDITKVDWTFIIGSVLSLIALLFTFDSISGERERGTLRLIVANSIPRHTVLTGKFLGALISITIPFTLAVLMNLLVISMSNDIRLDAEAWGRLSIIFFLVLVYTCLFLALGLLVSARARQSAVSLVILLLTWIVFVVFMPSVLPSIVSGFSPAPMTADEFQERIVQLDRELLNKYDNRLWADETLKTKQVRSEYVTRDTEIQERLNEEHLTQQIDQVQRSRTVSRVSPVTIFQHLLESFAGTGFERHLQFLENAQHYAREYREFVIDTDSTDPESLHLIGVREGMSQKPVNPAAVPKFEDTLSLSKDFNTAAVDLLLLTLFVLVLLSGAYLAFVRVEV